MTRLPAESNAPAVTWSALGAYRTFLTVPTAGTGVVPHDWPPPPPVPVDDVVVPVELDAAPPPLCALEDVLDTADAEEDDTTALFAPPAPPATPLEAIAPVELATLVDRPLDDATELATLVDGPVDDTTEPPTPLDADVAYPNAAQCGSVGASEQAV
jgi:hypothetical protein